MFPMEPLDYRERRYLSAVEAARILGVSTRTLHPYGFREVGQAWTTSGKRYSVT